MSQPDLAGRVAAVRRFNRFYTRKIGVLNDGLLGSGFSLTETRVLYELAHARSGARPTAAELGRRLGLDAGYLSRMLRGFRRRGLVARDASPTDGRQGLLRLTAEGEAAFAPLDRRAEDEVAAMIGALPSPDQDQLLGALATVEALLGDGKAEQPAYVLRSHRPGDMGWIVHRQAVLYAAEYGWDESFEALAAEIVAAFLKTFDPQREHCWIAERDGGVVGSVFLVRETDAIAKLRLLYVEPSARGLGIGRRLVEECVRFARRAGYRKITLWTNDVLHAARRIYQQAGFVLVDEERHHSFGHDLVGQTWDLDLAAFADPSEPRKGPGRA